MSELPQVSAEKLKAQLHGMVDEFAERIMQGVNTARFGHLIDDTEEWVRQVGHEFLQAAYQAALQQKIDAAEASFPPSGEHDDRSGDQSSREETAAQQGASVADGADGQRPRQTRAPLVARSAGRGGKPGAGR
jgi:hypothetical protein